MGFRFGIWQIFQALLTGAFTATPEDRQHAAQLEHHFHLIVPRFVFALQETNCLMQQLSSLGI